MPRKVETFAIGDRVAYAARYLRSIADNSRCGLRGSVVEVANLGVGFTIAYVHWDGYAAPVRDADDNMPCGVNTANLVAVRRIASEAATADDVPQGGFRKLVKGL